MISNGLVKPIDNDVIIFVSHFDAVIVKKNGVHMSECNKFSIISISCSAQWLLC